MVTNEIFGDENDLLDANSFSEFTRDTNSKLFVAALSLTCVATSMEDT